MISSSVNQSVSGSDAYTDLSSLNSIREIGRQDKNQALGEIAKQFESMMVRMMMKSMRSANQVFSEGNLFSSNEGEMYEQMFDDQMALTLSQGRGLGVADVMVRQLQQRFGVDNKTNSSGQLSDYQRAEKTQTKVAIAQNFVDPLVVAESSNKRDKEFHFDGSSEKFVSQLYAMAEKSAKKLGQTAEVLLAQAALETGWGKKITGIGDKTSFNLFNIKADQRWHGDSVSVSTIEVRNGAAVREQASFRAYKSPQQSFDDYVDFISNSPRYESALKAGDSEQYINALSEAGYATDPHYSSKILRIINSPEIQQAANTHSQLALDNEG